MGQFVLLVVSPSLNKQKNLSILVGGSVLYIRLAKYFPFLAKNSALLGVLAWGNKPSSVSSEKVAIRLLIPLIRVEDGFVRSILPGDREPTLSLVFDEIGIYYNSLKPSQLDHYANRKLASSMVDRAESLRALWTGLSISKYNHSPEAKDLTGPSVLVIDQTKDDASVQYGQGNEDSFGKMLRVALESFPEHTILVKTHPEVISGKKKGYLINHPLLAESRVVLLAEDVHPPSLLAKADAVFCVTSQMGFEALLWGKPVHCFGMPFYAGRGLTIDYLPAPEFRRNCSLEQLVHAALVDYCRYVDPETGVRCEPERAIEWVGFQRKMMARFEGELKVTRFPRWKRPHLRRFFFGARLAEGSVDPAAPVIVWGMGPVPAQDEHRRVIRVEDGFIRSAGLGVDLTAPQSWVLDSVGMYYDSGRPSGLEELLQSAEIESSLMDRADALIERLRTSGATKYNVGLKTWRRPANGKKVILVPGQVESDASVQYGSPRVKTNDHLLQAVRERNPDAWIVYKVHPDVVAGMRKGQQQTDSKLFDELVKSQDMHHMLMQVDEVHTMTSLAGFEALIRGKKVVCYGQPFYSGWGLTEDLEPVGRRTRKRSLNELVAAALIMYPTYVSATTGYFTTVERVLDEIEQVRGKDSWLKSLRRMLSRYVRFMWRF